MNPYNAIPLCTAMPRLPMALAAGLWLLLCAVPAPALATTISAGYEHSCSVSDAGVPTCWGAVPLDPKAVPATGLADIKAGSGFSCALLASASVTSGSVICWGGNNEFSQTGTNTSLNPGQPIRALRANLSGADLVIATQIAMGARHACAVTRDAEVYCWGDAGQGQLGVLQPAQTMTGYAVKVQGLQGAVRVAAGNDSTCAVLRAGSVACVGEGSLLAGTQDDPGTPQMLPDITDAVDVSIFDGHGCVLRSGGQVACWGRNGFGQLGIAASAGTQTTPAHVAGLPGPAKAVAAGYGFSCALMVAGTVHCWGNHADYQLGVGYLANRATTTAFGHVVGITDATALSAGLKHACAALDGGYVQCWGTGPALGHNLCRTLGAFYPNTGYQPAANPTFNLAICDPPRSATPFAVSSLAPLDDAYRVLDWAERSLPATFPALGKQRFDESGRNYVGRHYANGRTLAINGHGTPHLMYLGPDTNGQLLDLGTLAPWLREARK